MASELRIRNRELAVKNRRLAEQRDQLREALETATNIIDKMGDMPDRKICPIVWRDLECEGAVDKARAALKATEEG